VGDADDEADAVRHVAEYLHHIERHLMSWPLDVALDPIVLPSQLQRGTSGPSSVATLAERVARRGLKPMLVGGTRRSASASWVAAPSRRLRKRRPEWECGAAGVGAPMLCLCTTLGQDGLTARLLVVPSESLLGAATDARIRPTAEAARAPLEDPPYGTVLGPSSRAACPAPSAFGVVELNGRSA
jgi:hypothetical protein